MTATELETIFRFTPYIKPLISEYLTYAYGLADIVFCPSEYTRSLLIADGLNPAKLVVQSNGVDLTRFHKDLAHREVARKERNLQGIVVGNVALVLARKGVEDFIWLAKQFSHTNFLWFGKMYSGILVKPLTSDHALNTTFAGYVSDTQSAYNAMDIFMFPSYEENQGMVLLEAGAVGLPLLVRDIPVYEGWLVHNENCLKAKTQEEFRTHLKALIEDESLRKRLGEQAFIVAQKNSIPVLTEHLKKTYEHLLSGGM